MELSKIKERKSQLASDIRRSNSEAALAIKELVSLHVEEAKDTLVKEINSTDNMLRAQGAVHALLRLHIALTKEPAPIKREGDNQ